MKQLIITLCLSTATLVGMAQNEPYRNPNLSPEERAAAMFSHAKDA